MKKAVLLGAFCLFWVASPTSVCAFIEGSLTANPVIVDGGNSWRPISVSQSTTAVVIISTTPVGSLVTRISGSTVNEASPIQTWRFREIVNMSTCANLALYPSSMTYTVYKSSFGVVLSSDVTGGGLGDSYVVPHQGPVWGIWSGGDTGCGNGGQGAGGTESWYDPKRDALRLPEGQK